MILGITEDETVMLDLDGVTYKTARYWARRALYWHKLGGFIIAKSSKDHYHIVFNKRVNWTDNMSIIAWVALLSHNEGLAKWHIMQCIKKASTLRVSPKGEKPAPRIVYREGDQDGMIANYLEYRRTVKKIWGKLEPAGELSDQVS